LLRDYVELPRQVHLLCLGALINRAGSFALVFLTIYLKDELGFGTEFATSCLGVFGVCAMVAAVLGGHLADQWGRRPVLLIATFGGSATLLAMSQVQDRWSLMVLIGLFALLNEMYRPAASAMIGDLTLPRQRAQAFSLMYVAINLGFAVAPPLGGWLSEHSWQMLFVCDAATAAAFGTLILVVCRDTKPVLEDDESSTSTLEAARFILGDGRFLLFCLATLLVALVYLQGMSTLPIHIRNSGFTNAEFGELIAINGVLIVLLQLPLTHLLRRFNHLVVIMIGGVFVAAGFGLTAFATSAWMFAVSIAVWTLGEIMQAAFNQAVVTDLAPAQMRARYFGCFSLTFSLSLSIGAPLGGIVLEQYGDPALWSGCVAIAMLAVVLYLILLGRKCRAPSRNAD
jgi:predicted MFS family arabinose efflux permease